MSSSYTVKDIFPKVDTYTPQSQDRARRVVEFLQPLGLTSIEANVVATMSGSLIEWLLTCHRPELITCMAESGCGRQITKHGLDGIEVDIILAAKLQAICLAVVLDITEKEKA